MPASEGPSATVDDPAHELLDADRAVERPGCPLATPRTVWRDFGTPYLVNGLIGLIFSASGPVAIILAAGSAGHLSTAELTSWIFGVFVLNGILTLVASWVYRMPLAFAWTIPGTVLVGSSLQHLSWGEVLGAFLVTGGLIALVGATGRVRQVMSALPTPIVMAMVAGVFLQFGVDVVDSVGANPAVSLPIIVVFFVLLWSATLRRWVPPIIGAFVAGGVAVAISGGFHLGERATSSIAAPAFQAPEFSLRAIFELVVPLAITVIVVQNGQGVAVLRSAGHRAPVNVLTVACGIWSMAAASIGAISTCLAGPTNALLVAGGARQRQYTAGLTFGVLAVLVGVFAPVFVELMLAMPAAFIATIGGLALLGALQNAFRAAFEARFTLGALVTFLVSISDLSVLNIGAPFWGLVAGVLVSWIVERRDFAR
ncbi:benzoate/H(+) symporter BenE family transporter [Gordonia bronchialis]|uniref:benzoate/H(+) symporter BenE family transporter n=1 Tax=Gordonia bronchialis TaxID=2054 RepID=UPI00227124A4|nr:benzoate/H(+) symporter BenE family transporter [Gordonia bronchialis]